VETDAQTVTVLESNHSRQLGRDDLLEFECLPGFRIAIAVLFTPPQPK
jgi:hypothetical protein